VTTDRSLSTTESVVDLLSFTVLVDASDSEIESETNRVHETRALAAESVIVDVSDDERVRVVMTVARSEVDVESVDDLVRE
jgi:NADH:ubiquinone oxidoreductase subunit C